MSGGQKTLKAKLNLKGDYQARVHSGQMVLVAAGSHQAGAGPGDS